MNGDFIVVHLDSNQEPVYAEAFNTEDDAERHADSAPADVDVWLARARSGRTRLLREHTP